MAITLTGIPGGYDVWGKTRSKLSTCACDSSYPAGGYAITPANIGFRSIEGAMNAGSILATASGGYIPVWDQLNGKLRVFNGGSPGTEVTTATNLTGISFNMLFLGN